MRVNEVKQLMVETLTQYGWSKRLATEVIEWRAAFAQRARMNIAEFIQRGVYLDKRP